MTAGEGTGASEEAADADRRTGPVRVTTGARLHFGFRNLSLSRERLYGGLGVAVDAPRLVVEADPADEVRCDHPDARTYARRAADRLGVDGAAVTVRSALPRHVGLGSGTQLALATLLAVARSNGRAVDVRAHAPGLGRGGRSGVGVAVFEAGGFVVDAGHPTDLYTADPPPDGEWTVPPVAARHDLPDDWRFVVAVPDAPAGRSGPAEREAMRSVLADADPAVADEVARLVAGRLLPAAAAGDLPAFGAAVAAVGRRNGAWFAGEQGGVYRPPAGTVVEALSACPAVAGAGQSSWGPAVYAVTDREGVDSARAAARKALAEVGSSGGEGSGGPDADGSGGSDADGSGEGGSSVAGSDVDSSDVAGGTVRVAPPRNEGAVVERL